MEPLVFKMEVYEGPLDLLLALIAKHKMDIRDIQISLIFDQYMAYVEEMKRMDMEVAGEFITMASELMLIKSKMLLPRQEEEEDPRAGLVRTLMEYQTAKEVASWLGTQEKNFAGRFEKDTDEIEPDKGIYVDMDAAILTKALERMLLRMGERQKEEQRNPIEKIQPLIHKKEIPISEKIVGVMRLLMRKKQAHVDDLFEEATSRAEIIAIFYATLELLKAGRVTLQKEVGDVTNSNVILHLNMEHKRDEKEENADG